MTTPHLNTSTSTHAAWDAFVLAHPRAHFLQLSGWGTLKQRTGWSADRVTLIAEERIIAGAQLLFRPLPLRLGTLAYIGHGGFVDHPQRWPALFEAVHHTARTNGAAFLKWEPGFFWEHDAPDYAALGFQPSPQRIQPPRTVLLDLHKDDDALQSHMNQSTRRNIRKAYKNDVRYFEATPDDLPRFSDLMRTTGERNEFGVHQPGYFEQMYELFVPEHAALILAEHEGDLIAANFVFGVGPSATYLEGASSNEKRNLMASYGVQWEAIQWARRRRCRYYDMWGVPDEDQAVLEEQFQERNDGLWGVYRFKRGFGGSVERTPGAWDYVYNPLVYNAYKLALRLRDTRSTTS